MQGGFSIVARYEDCELQDAGVLSSLPIGKKGYILILQDCTMPITYIVEVPKPHEYVNVRSQMMVAGQKLSCRGMIPGRDWKRDGVSSLSYRLMDMRLKTMDMAASIHSS